MNGSMPTEPNERQQKAGQYEGGEQGARTANLGEARYQVADEGARVSQIVIATYFKFPARNS